MRKEYDFTKGVRGKHAKKYKAGTNIVLLDPDVAKVFKTPTSVNQALRTLAKIIKAQIIIIRDNNSGQPPVFRDCLFRARPPRQEHCKSGITCNIFMLSLSALGVFP